jgi:hypothetical protein
MNRTDGQPRQAFAQADLELAKWLALVTMAIDHYGKIVDDSVFLETNAIGRVSFPLFAAIIGIRLATRPELARRYLRYLIPWALVSQPVFVLVGREWHEGNIMFTLALGVLAAFVWRHPTLPEWSRSAAFAAILGASAFVDYGPIGVLMIPATAWLFGRSHTVGVAAVGPLGLAANLIPSSPPLQIADLAALLASPILFLSLKGQIRLPRLQLQRHWLVFGEAGGHRMGDRRRHEVGVCLLHRD